MSDKYKSIFDEIVGIKNAKGDVTSEEKKKVLFHEIFGGMPDEVIYNTEAINDRVSTSTVKIDANSGFWDWRSTPIWSANIDLGQVQFSFDPKLNANTDPTLGAFRLNDEPEYDIHYVFNEDIYLEQIADHIDSTYSGHYGQDGIQATEVIIDAGHGTGFNIGNIIKYAKRYGHKNGYNRQDILKIIHYGLMQLYVHDKEELGE